MIKQDSILPSAGARLPRNPATINWTWLIASRLCFYMLAVVLPPVAVACVAGCWAGDLLVNLLLSLALWVPGILHALYIIPRYENFTYVGCLDESDLEGTNCSGSSRRMLKTCPATRELIASCRNRLQGKKKTKKEDEDEDVEATAVAAPASAANAASPRIVLSPPPDLLPGGFRPFHDTHSDSSSDDVGSGVAPSLL